MHFRKLIFVFLLHFAGYQAYSQNLVANGSFQDLNVCTELKAPCSPSAWKTTSPHLMMYGAEKDNYFARLTIFNSSIEGVRKYMQTRLLCPLKKDRIYILTVRFKPDKVFMSSFGVLFVSTPVYNNNDLLLRMKPTIDLSGLYAKVPYNRRLEWYKITVEYKASGDEKYLILGNFQSDTDQKRVYQTKPRNFTDYEYHIDDVELIPKVPEEPCRNYEKIRQQMYSQKERHPQRKFNMFGEEDPDSAEAVISESIDTLRLGSVYFEFDSDRLNSVGKTKLDSLFSHLVKEEVDSIRIYGHTDSMGPKDYNLDLSYRRAKAIERVLKENNLSAYVSEVKGFGDKLPRSSNSTDSGRKKNRRVEVIIYYKVRSS
jgi:outer membrane protein OmpA-like peptidoglycan-associated protein